MKTNNRVYYATLVLFLSMKAQAQSYPQNTDSQPQVVVTSAPSYTTYQTSPVTVVPQGVIVPPGAIYIAPTYPAPAVGFVWEYHPKFGWGWRHPAHGWHRGWR
jgi:hypothetical protein